ncbi:MAG TPA: hypothetical protein VLA78_06935 [Paracoccaceae bacterium]|nr:hypothetical protein [Paracoccaceae bacterium]
MVSGIYAATQWLSLNVLYPLQTSVVPEIDLTATLVFLPHGVKIVAAWMFGWRALAYLLPALAWRIANGGAIDIPRIEFAVMATFLMASAPLAFSLMRAFGIDVIGDRALAMNWRVLMFVGLVSSVMNAVAIHVIAFHELPATEHLPGMFRIVAGDMVGLFVVLALLMLGARWLRGWGQA